MTDYSDLLNDTPKPRKSKQNPVEKIETIAQSETHKKSVGWSQDDIEVFALGFSMLLMASTEFISKRMVSDNRLGMPEDDAKTISEPLARLILRHIKIKGTKKGDITDGMAVLIGFGTYGFHVASEYESIKQFKVANNVSANSNPNGTIIYR